MAFELKGRICHWNLAAEKALGCPIPMLVDEPDNPDNNSTLFWKARERAWRGMF